MEQIVQQWFGMGAEGKSLKGASSTWKYYIFFTDGNFPKQTASNAKPVKINRGIFQKPEMINKSDNKLIAEVEMWRMDL